MNHEDEWIMKMAELEDGCSVSVGGAYVTFYRQLKEQIQKLVENGELSEEEANIRLAALDNNIKEGIA